MKVIVLISILIVLIFPSTYKIKFTILMSFLWLLYTIYYCYKLYKLNEKKINTYKYSISPPNNGYSPYIRYLYNRKIDYKVFLSVVLELLIKNSISLKIENNNQFYIIDNKIPNESLKNSEVYAKKILFKDIGEGSYIRLNEMFNTCKKNSGYLYSVYSEWKNVFEYEVAFNSYFKSNKTLVDKSTSFLIISFILSLYNIIFARNILVGIFIFSVGAMICKYINDLKILEDDVLEEYVKWLEFKNYINKYDNNLNEIDGFSLENYATYAYVLDSSEPFMKSIENKNLDKSLILSIMHSGVFNEIDYIFQKSINKININAILLFAKNKGRR